MSLLTKRRLEVNHVTESTIIHDHDYDRYDSLRMRCHESVHPDAHPYTIMERARLIQLAAHSAGFDEGHVEVEYWYNGLSSYLVVEGAGQVTTFDRSGLEP